MYTENALRALLLTGNNNIACMHACYSIGIQAFPNSMLFLTNVHTYECLHVGIHMAKEIRDVISMNFLQDTDFHSRLYTLKSFHFVYYCILKGNGLDFLPDAYA